LEKIFLLGLPLKTWFLIIIPTITTGFIPYITAEILSRRDDNDE
jgi:hypothetical protein